MQMKYCYMFLVEKEPLLHWRKIWILRGKQSGHKFPLVSWRIWLIAGYLIVNAPLLRVERSHGRCIRVYNTTKPQKQLLKAVIQCCLKSYIAFYACTLVYSFFFTSAVGRKNRLTCTFVSRKFCFRDKMTHFTYVLKDGL